MAAECASGVDFEKVDFENLTRTTNMISHGSNGAVYGPCTLNGQMFAFKAIWIHQETPCDFAERVEYKKSIWTSLNHKHLIKIWHVKLGERALYLAMECASGGSLRSMLDTYDARVHRPINVTNWARQIAEGMLYLHENDIVHRDLKSLNVVLMNSFTFSDAHEDITLKITDFDEVKRHDHTTIMSCRGTLAYMAPEVRKKWMFSKASDVWSYATVFWEMLTLEHPGVDADHEAILHNAHMTKLALPIHVSSPEILKKLLHDCWSQDLRSRPSFRAIVDQLGRIVSNKGIGGLIRDEVSMDVYDVQPSLRPADTGIGGLIRDEVHDAQPSLRPAATDQRMARDEKRSALEKEYLDQIGQNNVSIQTNQEEFNNSSEYRVLLFTLKVRLHKFIELQIKTFIILNNLSDNDKSYSTRKIIELVRDDVSVDMSLKRKAKERISLIDKLKDYKITATDWRTIAYCYTGSFAVYRKFNAEFDFRDLLDILMYCSLFHCKFYSVAFEVTRHYNRYYGHPSALIISNDTFIVLKFAICRLSELITA